MWGVGGVFVGYLGPVTIVRVLQIKLATVLRRTVLPGGRGRGDGARRSKRRCANGSRTDREIPNIQEYFLGLD